MVRIQSTFIEHLFIVNCVEKTNIKKIEAGNGPFKKTFIKSVNFLMFNVTVERKYTINCFAKKYSIQGRMWLFTAVTLTSLES